MAERAETPAQRQQRLRRRLRWRGRLAELTRSLVVAEPAPRAEISAAEKALSSRFPADYVAFLSATNGAGGEVGGRWVRLWPASALRRENAERHSPLGLVLVGAAEGGGLLGFRHGRYLLIREGEGLGAAEELGERLVDVFEAVALSGG